MIFLAFYVFYRCFYGAILVFAVNESICFYVFLSTTCYSINTNNTNNRLVHFPAYRSWISRNLQFKFFSFLQHFPTYAVLVVVLCGSTNMFLGESCGCLEEGRGRFTFWLRSIYGSFAVFTVHLRFPEVLWRCRTAQNRGLNRGTA